MKASNIIGICQLGTIVTAAAAFRPIIIAPLPALQRRPSTSSTALMAHHYRHHFHHPHHPFNNPNHPINSNNRWPPNIDNNKQQQQWQSSSHRPVSPLSSSTVDAEVLTEAEELLNEQQFYYGDDDGEEEEAATDDDDDDDFEGGWNKPRSSSTKDYRTTKQFRTAGGGGDSSSSSTNNNGSTKKQSEVINFDPEQPIFKPLKSADENNNNDDGFFNMEDPFEEEYDDFMKFQRKQNARRNHQHEEHFPHHQHQQRPPHPGMMPPPDMEFEFNDFGIIHEFDDFGDGFFDGMPPPHPHMMPPPPMDMPPPPHFFGHDGPGPMDGPMFMSDDSMDGEENFVDRVDFTDHGRPVNDRDNTGSVDTFFSDRPATKSNNGPQQRGGGGRRGGPSVYTQEEEELIASMSGMGPPPPPGRPSTQAFAEAGTQSAMRKYQQQAPGPMPPQYREEGYLGDSTLKEISMDYGIPITYLADVLANWGVPIPIDPNGRLGDMVTGEQAFAILEAIHTLDVAELHERYAEDDLMNLCDYYDLDIKLAFDFCMERGWALPFGVRTFLRVEQEAELLDALAGGDGGMY